MFNKDIPAFTFSVSRDMTTLSGMPLEVARFLPCFHELKAVQYHIWCVIPILRT